MRTMACCLLIFLGACFAATTLAQEGLSLADRLQDRHVRGTDFWTYNNLAAARAQAKAENKPLMVTFRCVPCDACEAFDAEVAAGRGAIEKLARENFVAVRQVEMKGVDLSQFQFDYDLNWAAMFINADGTVYARYGTQSAEGPDAYNSVTGLVNTMQRVLELHANYPNNKAELAGKRGPQQSYQTALEMPGMRRKDLLAKPTTKGNCIHCHMIHDAEHFAAADRDDLTTDILWRYPLPENLGIVIEADHGRKIREILPDSVAAETGLKPGEEVTHVAGQVIASIADIQWALDQTAAEADQVTIRGSESGDVQVALNSGWKKTDISWRGSMWSFPPKLRTWAPPLTAEERQARNLPADRAAFLVKWINRGEPGGKAVFKAGIREGDVIVAIDGEPVEDVKAARLQAGIKLKYNVGDKLPITVIRDGNELGFEVPLVE